MIESVSRIDSKNSNMLRFHGTIKNRLVPNMLAAGANRKMAPVSFFIKFFCATPTVYLFHQPFFFFYVITATSINNHFKRLVLII